MRQKQAVVGTYPMGYEQVELVLREGSGGEFWLTPAPGKVPRAVVGVESSWSESMASLLHELLEMALTQAGRRFSPDPQVFGSHDLSTFVIDHPEFCEVVSRVATVLAACLPDFGAAWKKFRKETSS